MFLSPHSPWQQSEEPCSRPINAANAQYEIIYPGHIDIGTLITALGVCVAMVVLLLRWGIRDEGCIWRGLWREE